MTENPESTLTDFAPVPVRNRHDGWTAERQRAFIEALADGGCVSEACAATGVTARSAYRLRRHPRGAAFARAWDRALMVASSRLVSLAFDRAVHGTRREVWRDGQLVMETREPSDKLLMFLLRNLDIYRFGSMAGLNPVRPDPLPEARAAMPGAIEKLTDIDCPADPLGPGDYAPRPLTDESGLAHGEA